MIARVAIAMPICLALGEPKGNIAYTIAKPPAVSRAALTVTEIYKCRAR